MASIFDDAPRTTARVLGKSTTTDALTDLPSNTVFVEFADAEGRPSRGSQDYSMSRRCSLEPEDEVEIAYLPFGEDFDRLTEPFLKVSTGIMKGILGLVGKEGLVDDALEESARYEHYRISILDFDRYLS